jgi:hypothetical protein
MDIVSSALNEFHIPMSKIYETTTDNGSNFVKCVKLMRAQNKVAGGEEQGTANFFAQQFRLAKHELSVVYFYPFLHHIFDYSDGEDSESENECRYLEQDEIIREDENDNATFQLFQDQCVILQGVRCIAHTLQLVVLKAIGSDKCSNIISRARNYQLVTQR